VTYEFAEKSPSELSEPVTGTLAGSGELAAELPAGLAAPASERASGRSRLPALPFIAKAFVAASLCAFIIARIDWDAAWGSLTQTGWAPVSGMFGIMVACVFLSAYKWRLLLAIHGIQFGLGRLSRYYFVAVFFNNFLPTSIGGDGYRIYKTLENGRSKASAVIAVAMERLTGFGGLVVLGAGAALWLAADIEGFSGIALALAAALIAGPMLAWRLRDLVPPRLYNAVPQKVRQLQKTIVEHLDDYLRQPGKSASVIGISLLFHVGVAFAYYLILRYGADQPITMLQVLTVLTVATLVAVLPISINGLGVFEGTFMYLLAQYGVPTEVSIVPMILNRGLLIALSLAGAGAYLFEKSSRR
jgi:glycosyltransferase 2 family protein